MKHMGMLMGLLVVAVLGVGCLSPAAMTPPPAVPTPLAPAQPEFAARQATGSGDKGADTGATGVQPMIVKTAELSLVVPDTKAGLNDVTRIAVEAGGHVTSSKTQKQGDRLLATVIIRVPVASFEAVLEQLRKLGDVQADSVGGEDVTAEYVDLESRLKNLEAVEKELLTILTETREKGGKAEDVLAIYREITAIRGEIETIKGRMKYLTDRAAMSTVTVHLSPTVPETQVVPKGWYPDQTLKNALSALVTLLQFLTDLGIWLAVFSVCLLPFLVIAGVVLLIVWIRRRRGKRA